MRREKKELDLNETQNTQGGGHGGRGRGDQGRGRRDRDDVKDDTNQTRLQNWHDRGQVKGRGDWSKLEVKCFRCGKYDHYARECRSISCYNCGKASHIAKFCRTEEKMKTLLIEEDDEEDIRILMMMQNSDAELRSCKSKVE